MKKKNVEREKKYGQKKIWKAEKNNERKRKKKNSDEWRKCSTNRAFGPTERGLSYRFKIYLCTTIAIFSHLTALLICPSCCRFSHFLLFHLLFCLQQLIIPFFSLLSVFILCVLRCRRCRSRLFCFVRLHFDHSLMHFKALWKQADIHLNEFHCRKSGYYCFAYGSCCLLISIATVKKEVISLQCNHNEAKRLSKNSHFYWSATKQKKARAHTAHGTSKSRSITKVEIKVQRN